MKEKRLTNILLQAIATVDILLLDKDYLENVEDLRKLRSLIEDALNIIENEQDNNKDNFDKVVKIVDLMIKILGVKGLTDFL